MKALVEDFQALIFPRFCIGFGVVIMYLTLTVSPT